MPGSIASVSSPGDKYKEPMFFIRKKGSNDIRIGRGNWKDPADVAAAAKSEANQEKSWEQKKATRTLSKLIS